MPDLTERIASLPPEKRQLFEKLLKQERLEIRQPAFPSVIHRQPRGQGTHKFVTSFAQARLWFLDQFAPGSSAYNMPFALRLKGALVVAALERAMTEVVRRHEVLRTRFAVEEGEPVQVVDEPKPFVLPVVQVSEEQEIEQLIREEASQPFDLETGPLVRARLLRLSEAEQVLVFTMHHIVSDGWSMGVLMREVGALYEAYSRGTESPLKELPVQYGDFAMWQREWLRGEALERQLDYWRKQLADAPATLELPVEKARPAVLSSQTAQAELLFPGAAVTGLRELGRQEGCTLFMTFLAAFQIVLWRYSRQRDLVIGTPVANRKQSGTEGLIGFFVNTLALRTQLDETITFRELLAHVRETCLGAYAHQDVPFEKLVEELGVKREPNRNPLFDVMLVLQGAGEHGVPGLGALEVKAEEWGGAGVLGAKFDLLLWLTEDRDGRVRGKLEYRAELFGEELMRRMVQHLSQVVAEAAAGAGETRLCELGLIGERERHQQLVEWNDTYTEYERERCVHELFEAHVERAPQDVALIYRGEELSYRELNRRANQLAHYLRRKGVGPESVVGLLMERSAEMIVSLLAILKAGGAYLPLDPRHPEARLRMMVEDAGATLLLTQGLWPRQLSETAIIVCVDEEGESIANESDENPPCVTTPDNLIYLMYTSGSTGIAKGVAVTHRSVMRLVRGANYVELGPEQVLLQLAPMSFDASTFEVWGALLNGARLVVAPRGPLSLEEVGRVVRESSVTVLWLTAGLFHQMVDERPDDLREVRQLLAGGDVLSPRHVRTVLELCEGNVLVNGYGPTENTTFTACNRLSEAWEIDATVSIGRPISNTQIYILDDALQPVPVGVAGELYTGGDGLARGYLRRPALTAERFVPNPFSLTGGGRLYRTGDWARYLEDGRIEFAGRMDHQVKVRGYRIEPGEVETAVIACAGVRKSVVVVREDARGEKLLVAYVVGESAEPLRPGELRASLRERLPDYMIPSVFVMLDELPLTPNGKVDRRALPVPEQTGEQTGDGSQAPRTPTEEVLAEIFADVLHVTSVGIGENFFELGGHSLLATRVVSQVRTAFGVEVALRTLFERPSVAGLSEEIATLLRAESESEVPPLVKRESTEPAPLSFAQQRLWFLDQFEPGSSAYNMPFALRVTGSLEIAVLERALTEVVRRHEVLRTTFSVVNEQPVQVIGDPPLFALQIVEVEEEQRVRQLIREEATQPFDLERGPLARARLLKLGEQEHVLLFTMHHIVSDGWSMDVLMKEVGALYDAYQHGKESPLEELPIQYADYAVWQRDWLRDEALDRQLEYWRKQLADAPALELPTDRPRPAVQRFEGATVSFALDTELTDGLRDFSRREGATLFMTLLAVLQTLLMRYTGQADVSVGTPVAGRTRAETEALVGFFVNTLVLRVDASGDPTFSELVGRVKDVCLGAYAHQDVPFEKLVEELQPDREMSRSPLFQVMFTLQNAPRETLTLPGVTLSILDGENRNAKFDLMLTMAEGNKGLQGWFEYNTDLFDAEPIERMAQHFQTLVRSILAEPSQPAGALRLMDQAERLRVVVDWNNTGVVYAQAEKCIQEIFEEQVEKTPDHVALVSSEGSLLYAELNSRANQLAHYLRRRGVGPESLVGIMIERSAAMVVALLGILKAGGSYLPLDPDYPRDRLTFMLADAGVEVLLSETHLSERLPQLGSPVILIDAEHGAIQQESEANPLAGATPENLAYVLYTSGSTGKPKGAMLAHREVVNCVLWMQQTYELNATDRMLCKTTLNFDPSVWEVFWPLMIGSRIVLTTPRAQLDSVALLQTIIDEQATVVYFVPSMLALFLSEAGVANATSLRKVICGGESLGIELVKRFYELLPQATLHHSYGPTETAIASSETICDPHSRHSVIPIGRPLANTQLYVLDAQMQLAPIGILGELFIGGGGLGRGYLNRPDLTAEKFIPNHFSNTPGARLYRTGDRVRYLADGNLQFHGRGDAQVKVRGIRIELGEIEAAIMAHGKVHSTVVDARADRDGEKSLVGYIVAAQGANLTAAEIRQALSRKLPTYMVPSSFVFLSEIPLLPNGKVDRRALPAPDEARDVDGSSAPRTPTEEIVAEIFADVLHVASVGIAENFFALGGHSLVATRVVSRVRTAFGVEMALRSLFERPTVAGLSEEIERLLRVGTGLEVPPLVKRESDEAAPLSFAQARLWFLDQFEPGSSTYNMPFALRLKGSVHVGAIERALTEVVRRHEVLRTRFVVEEGEPVQVVDEPKPFVLRVVQVGEAIIAAQGRQVEQLIREEASLPFDLEAGPLVRAKLLELSADEHVLLFTMHHIISDGWSMGVLMREVGTLYDAYSQGQESPFEELPIQYADYAVWQREWLQGEAPERQLEYWRKQLADAPVVELPTERVRPAVLSTKSAGVDVRLSAQNVAGLRELGRREGCTLFMTLLAAFQVVLWRYTGQSDLVVGTPVANRGQSGTEGLIGFFVNTLPLRAELNAELTFRELLGRVRETSLGAYAHQDVPFEKLVEELGVRRELNRNPLFDVMLVLQGAGEQGVPRLEGLEVSAEGANAGSVGAKFDLLLGLSEELGGGLRGKLEYRAELFGEELMCRMGQHLECAVAEVVAHGGEGTLGELRLLSEEERSLQLVEWNDTFRDYERERCVQELFEAQSERTPQALALVCGGEEFSYRELNRRANQLAHYLKRKGVGPESVVGVLMERSAEMVVSLLAILKAGGAYLPLDPEYPAARLQMMLEDSGAVLLIARGALAERVPADAVTVVNLEDELESIAAESDENLTCTTTAENLIYVMYTSGSTGRPKGVAVTHRSVMRLVRGANYVELGPEEVLLQLAPTTFDAATFEVWGALLNGARLVIVPPGPLSLEEIGRAVRDGGVTTLWLTAGLFNQMVDQRAEDLSGVRQLLAGGDVLSPRHVRTVLEACEGNVLVNGYGPTENTTFTACHRITHSKQIGETVSIGRPISNTQIYILDEGMRLAPAGVVGELYTGGDGLARGYLGGSALTAERFVPDPFSPDGGGRLYRTGDLARYMEDGRIEFLGRMDEQVKVRGFRIEPGEVEAAVIECEGVRECVVVVREARGEKLLVAYVVGESAEPPRPGELRASLRERLPDYMVPSTFVMLDELPLTPNGKVDRRALPALDGSRPELESRYVEPRTSLEKLLAEMWQEVLEVEAVGIHDDFFELGGTSLRVVVFVNKLEQRLGVHVPVKALFGAPNVAALAEYLKDTPAQTTSDVCGDDESLSLMVGLRPATGSWSPLVELQPGTTNTPLFFVHPVGGNIFCYFNLARRLGTDQPFYALQSMGLNDETHGHTRIEDMASYYVEHVRAVQPTGPYRIGGWSLGGVVAFEMARQLKASGDDVLMLTLIDSPSPSEFARMRNEDDLSQLASFAIDLGFTQEYLSRSFDDVRQLSLEEQLAYMLDRALAENLVPASMELEHLQRLFRVFKTNREALRAYVPGMYAGQVTYVQATGNGAGDMPRDWHELALGGVDVYQLPGDHYSILKQPYVDALAQCIDRTLENGNGAPRQ